MKNSALKFLGALLGLCLGAALVYLVLARTHKPAPNKEETRLRVPENEAGKVGDLVLGAEAMQLAEIRSAPVEVRTVAEKLKVTGEIVTGGNQVAKISPRVAGKVVRLLAQVGDQVRSGQSLAILESAELARAQAEYRQALARLAALENNLQRQRELASLGQFGRPQVEQSRTQTVESQRVLQEASQGVKELEARLAQSRAERDVLRLNLQRAKELNELVSTRELQRIQADWQKAEADVLAARARLEGARVAQRSAQSRLGIARSALKREEKVYAGRYLTSRELVEAESATRLAGVELDSAAERVRLLGGVPGQGSQQTLSTPISGKVQDLAVTLGETVPADRVAYTVINLQEVWAQLAVAPKDLPRVQLGETVELKGDAAPERLFRGRISHVSTSSDPTTRAVYLRALLENRSGALKTGSFVTGSLITEVRQKKVTVPLGALQEHMGRPTVYVALPGQPGAFEVRHVFLGAKTDTWQEVREGLKPGEAVAVSGTFYLKSQALKSSLSDGCCGGD